MHKVVFRTDPGKKRTHNEDALLVLPEHGLYVVADGVGGRACGEVAAAICVEAFRQAAPGLAIAAQEHDRNPTVDARNAVLVAMDEVCQTASRRIFETAEAEGRSGMTTTVVAMVFGRGTAFVAHVGDSRGFLLRDGQIRQLTEDHSMVNDLVRSGKMSLAEAKASRYRHVITRAVGQYPTVQPSLATVDVLPGDRFLICSDGLSDVVPESLICELGSAGELDSGAQALLQAALDRGGPDNVTLVLLDPAGGGRADEAAVRARMLESLFLFEDMPFAARLQVARIMREHWFAPGDTLVAQGSEDRSMFILLDGECTVQRDGVDVARLGAGEHFGELSLVDHEPRSATVVASSFGSAVSLSGEQLEEFCRREPVLGAQLLWKLLRVMGQRLRDTTAKLAQPEDSVH